jgi:uncharacterized protein
MPMTVTPVTLETTLPLTCTRLGTCCHGHMIYLSPYEIARLALGMNLSAGELRDRYLDKGGMRLRFDGPIGTHGPAAHRKPACTFLRPDTGCSVHPHRPLACRLYPLGRQRVDGQLRYYFPGSELPCLSLCPTVTELPARTVGDYIAEQKVAEFEVAHDAYARIAYGMIYAAVSIITASKGSRADLHSYFIYMRDLSADERAEKMTPTWYDVLLAPPISAELDANAFADQHGQLLSTLFQQTYLHDPAADALQRAAEKYVQLAVHMSIAIGADPLVMEKLITGEMA